jgi:hypothetical protein
MKKGIFSFIFINIVILSFYSCHLFENMDETVSTQVYFNESNVTVFRGGLGSLTLKIEPIENLEYYAVDYEIANQQVAMIFKADRRGVVFSGVGIGSTIITARVGNAEAKAVINVINEI